MKFKRQAYTILLLITVCLSPQLMAQVKHQELSATEVAEQKEKVKHLVSFLEFAINTLGDVSTTTKEKEIIINQSYLKAFRDNKVIIEDDLDDNRAMINNKNVQAYLKDIDFFFQQVKFEFDIENVEYLVNEYGRSYFKVTLNRILNGITINADTVKSIKKRYIEINLDEAKNELKIASIYTTRLSEKDELMSWWSNLSDEWKSVLKKEIGAYDSIDYRLVQLITRIDKIDISNNAKITNLDGISRLSELRELSFSNTAIDDLLPLRNLTKLNKLDISNTKISDLEPLKYSVTLQELISSQTRLVSVEHLENLESLKYLDISSNSISSIEPIKGLENLNYLNASNTLINSLDAVDSLYNLRNLNISNTHVVKLDPLTELKKLEKLDVEGSQVRSIDPLKNLPNLKILIGNNTPLNNLESLHDHATLERIYCDNTLVTRAQANQFMAQNPNVLVIFKSDLLKAWWVTLNETWKSIFIKQVGVSSNPNKEELARIAKVNHLDISNHENISDLKPLGILENLKSISFANTGITDLTPLREMEKLEYINCSFNPIKSLEPLAYLRGLKVINIDQTEIENLSQLAHQDDLEMFYCDDTPIESEKLMAFAERYPSLLMIYKTDSLISWWNELEEEWINIFQRHLKSLNVTASISEYKTEELESSNQQIPSREDLHRIAQLQIISIKNNYNITDLRPLAELTNLRNLQVVNTRFSDLSPIKNLKKLRSIDISYNPVSNLSAMISLSEMVYLNIANTSVTTLDPIGGLKKMEELDCSGTPIKNLNALSGMDNLKLLNCSNTSIKSLSPIEDLGHLVRVSCFNTRLTSKRVEKFQKIQPNVEVNFY